MEKKELEYVGCFGMFFGVDRNFYSQANKIYTRVNITVYSSSFYILHGKKIAGSRAIYQCSIFGNIFSPMP